MEESVWISFGVIIAILCIGIVVTIFSDFKQGNDEQALFDGLQHLSDQAEIVCDAPIETQLSTRVPMPSGGVLYTYTDKICGAYGEKVRCKPVKCALDQRTLVNLTSNETRSLFSSHEYTCVVLRGDLTNITCEG